MHSVANTPVMAGGKVATSSGELAAKGTENEMPEASRGWGLLPPQPTNRSEGALWLWMWAPPVGSKKRKTNLSHSEHNWTLFNMDIPYFHEQSGGHATAGGGLKLELSHLTPTHSMTPSL